MNNFDLGYLGQWEEADDCEDFPGVSGSLSKHQFRILSSGGPVSVFAVDEMNVQPRLVAYGSGLLRIKFVALGAVRLHIVGDNDDGGRVFIWRREREPQLRRESDIPTFTNLDPRPAGPGVELQKMMHRIQINNRQREAALAAELERLNSRLEESERKVAKATKASRKEVIEEDQTEADPKD